MTQSATHLLTPEEAAAHPPLEAMVVRFAGDSGDGMQLTGGQFTLSTALAGNDLSTFPDFPAEIRAPQGTTFGVSAFQINFGSTAIDTAGDQPDVTGCRTFFRFFCNDQVLIGTRSYLGKVSNCHDLAVFTQLAHQTTHRLCNRAANA